ncbi:cysteine hydrolase family protein [Kribbella albertanoniae]|uniref:Cysteine hydrolase n=1 Tax=Kribbella albertanoniae TaxID=1266829 RepID=A0A4R4QKL2_9ACTN|nr:isochorismatase family cysteine hydrolase [Kribbella albertanoniae]TDC35792.1 cysteine hydrolase [Kribbella albertanoniae]
MAGDGAVLIVVDVQKGFVSPSSERVVPRVVDLLTRWRAAGRPYVLTRFVNQSGSLFEQLMGWTRVANSPETDLVPELGEFVDGAAAVIDKRGYSFFMAEGRLLLQSRGWSEFVIAGIATDACVLKTAVDAFEAGSIPWVVSDACASEASEEAHAAGLQVLGRLIGRRQLLTTDKLFDRFPSLAEDR